MPVVPGPQQEPRLKARAHERTAPGTLRLCCFPFSRCAVPSGRRVPQTPALPRHAQVLRGRLHHAQPILRGPAAPMCRRSVLRLRRAGVRGATVLPLLQAAVLPPLLRGPGTGFPARSGPGVWEPGFVATPQITTCTNEVRLCVYVE